MTRRIFISTAIPYVNGEPHIGHSLEYVQTDVLARYYRQQLGAANVFALTGTDENALKNVLAAEAAQQETHAYVDEKTAAFRDLYQTLNLSFDDFIRTTEARHIAGAQKLWALFKPEDIYQDTYRGLYCVGCEEFKTEKDLDGEGLCPEHKKKPEIVEEKNYFFKLSNYQDHIEQLITNDTLKIVPEKRKNEVLGFVREGLKDFSISRSRARARNWGVPVPGDADQVMYVWVDALSNYITALDFANNGARYHDFWESSETERIHVIGKGIVKFHALYWIGMLLSAGIPLPTTEFVHGYVTVDGNKIGKSLGNAIHPKAVVEKYGVDAFRYYLLKEIPAYGDGDFSWTRMEELYKADLQNGLGNLVARVAAMACNANYKNRQKATRVFIPSVVNSLSVFEFEKALGAIWGEIRMTDLKISMEKTWTLKDVTLLDSLDYLVEKILWIAYNLIPFMPQTADMILSHFSAEKIEKIKPLFPKIG